MLLLRSLHLPFLSNFLNLIYIPKGPVLDWTDPGLRQQVLQDLRELGHHYRALQIKIDPDVRMGTGQPPDQEAWRDRAGDEIIADLQRLGWKYSSEQIQFKNTVQIDLSLDQDQLLAAMKPKTRYNLRLASRKGVKVRDGGVDDIPALFKLFLETSVRDDFVIREEAYYRKLWSNFMDSGMAEALIAEVEGRAVAGLILFKYAGKAWFLFGMSGSQDREKMPNYLLQWEAILRLKQSGYLVYDLWGAPDDFVESDPLWGVYRFKVGLGGTTVRHMGAWDLPLSKIMYALYSGFLPVFLDWMRRRGKSRLRRMLE